jgi:hypothetical protein
MKKVHVLGTTPYVVVHTSFHAEIYMPGVGGQIMHLIRVRHRIGHRVHNDLWAYLRRKSALGTIQDLRSSFDYWRSKDQQHHGTI